MKETWRWFGPDDPVSLQDITQAGATGIVTALHHLPAGAIWSEREISLRNKEILLSKSSIDVDLKWNVVESLPVSEDIKRQSGDWRTHIKNYCISLENLAAAGISTICYNFIHKIFTARFDITSLSVLCLSKLHEVITRSIVTSVNPKSPSASKFAGF